MENKNKKTLIIGTLLTIIAFIGIAIPFGFGNVKNKLGASVSYSSNKYYYFNLEAFTNSLPSSTEEYDYMKVAFALQGLINREQPVLFYHYKPGPYQYVNTYYMEDVWESVLVNNNNILAGKQKVTLNSFDEVIELAKDMGVVNGAVLWDPKVPATANVASTIAGVENLVPIRKDISHLSCYTDLIVNRSVFTVQRDLSGKFTGTGYLPDANLNTQSSGTASTGSTKNDAYRWAKKYYLDTNKTSTSVMGYTRDAWIKPCSTGACFVDSSVPENMNPGEEREVTITVLNNNTNSNETWTKSGNYRIASNSGNGGHNDFKVTAAQYGFEQGDTAYGVRIYIDPDNDISVGERQRITFTIKAPDTAGTYRLNLGLVHDGYGWFNGTLDLTINVGSSSTANKKTEHYGTYPQGIFNAGLNTSDYLIANKAFFFDLSPDNSIAPIDDRGQTVGTDVATLTSLLSQQKTNANGNIFTVIGFVPWFVKYTSTSDSSSSMGDVAAEWKMIDYISTYNGQSDADAMSPVGLTNASLYRHQPLNSNLTQNNDKEAIKSDAVVKEVYDSNTKYFILFMGDYDCGAWTSGVLPTRFLNTTGNAKYPLTWPIASDLSDRVPQAFNWLYEHQERNDYFVAGDNGTGYLNPMKLDSSGRTTWKNHNISRNSQFDIDITGFLIGGNNTISNTIKSDYASISPVMVGYQGTLESSGSVGSTPFIPSANIAPNTSTLAQDIYNQLNGTSSKFIIIRTIQTSRAAAYDAIDQVYAMASANGKKFKLVDPYTMAQLYTDHPTKYKGCYSDGTNYQWVNATTIPSGYSYVDTVSSSTDCHKPRTKLTKPTMATSSYTFTGSAITPTITGYDSTKMTRTGDASGTNVGNYSTTYAITDKTNYEWADGTQTDITFNWSISKLTLTKPSISGTSTFVYNGTSQGPTVSDYVSSRMTKTGTTSKTNVGNYSATYALKDKTNTSWTDGTTTDVVLNWSITKAKITKPSITGSNEFTYNGTSQGPTITGFDVDKMTQTGYITRTNAGNYSAIYSLQNTDNYSWSDNSITDVTLNWSIAKATLTKPTLSGDSSFTYDGTEKSITVNGVDSNTMTQTGTTAETNAGNYTSTVSITNSNNYEWSDNTTSDIVFNWSIMKAALTKPTIDGSTSKTYNGGYQGLTFNDFDSNTMSVTGNNEIQVGSYTATISLQDTGNYSWSDGTTAALIYAWSIIKANINPTVTMANYYENSTPSTPVVTGNTGSGLVTFTYAVRGTDNYTSSAPTTKGLYTVKATIASTANYNGAVTTGNFEVLETQSEVIVLPEGSIITDVGLYGELIDSYNTEKGTSYDYTHLFTEAELASLETLIISHDKYHGVEVKDLSNLNYLTGLKNLTINLWTGCEVNTLNLSSNTELVNLIINSADPVEKLNLSKNTKLKTLSINNSTIEELNIAKSTLDSIDLDKPENIGYIMLDINRDVSYIVNSTSSQDETIADNSFGITCAKYNLDVNESTTCTVKGKTTKQMRALAFKLMATNNNITISNIQINSVFEGDRPFLLYGNVPLGEFNIGTFTITAVSGGTSKIYLDDFDSQNKMGYVTASTYDYEEVSDEISKTIYVNKYSMSDGSGISVTTGKIQTNYILNIINTSGVYEPAFNIAVLGDVKADGIIDIRDVAKAYDALANGIYLSYTNTEKYALDMNCDGLRSALDIIKIYDAIE